MKTVERIDNLIDKKEKQVEFTHFVINDGWEQASCVPKDFKKVIYLGHCRCNGDLFCCIDTDEDVIIYRGHLNSGKYE